MGGITRHICRLCLEVILDENYVVIEETIKEILDVLLIKIDFEISDSAVACSRCLEKLHDYFNFKSTCFYVDDYIAPFVESDNKVDIKKVFRKVMKTTENISLDDFQICRLCMSLLDDKPLNYIALREGFSDGMTRNCLPEVDLYTVFLPLICKSCLSNMKKYDIYMRDCHEVEQKIKNYIQGTEAHDFANTVILEDLLKFTSCEMVSISASIERKPLRSQDDVCIILNNNANFENLSKMDWDSKTELSNERQIRYSDTEEFAINEDVNGGKSLYHFETEVKQKMEKLYLPETANTDENQSDLSTISNCMEDNVVEFYIKTEDIDIKTEDDVIGDNCEVEVDKVTYKAKEKRVLKRHLHIHKDESELVTFNCDQCPYKAKRTAELKRHRIKHKVLSEIITFDCFHCPFKTRWQRGLKRHLLIHKDKSEIDTFNCDQCPYKSRQKYRLRRHLLIHKDMSQIVTFNCDQCPYKSRQKYGLTQHLLVHKDISQIVTFNCDQCPYKGKNKALLNSHLLIHKDKSEIVTFNCDQCPYMSRWNSDLRRHLLTHKDKSEIVIYKCDQCPYKGKEKIRLKRHLRTHADKPELVVVTFNCDQCPYKSRWKPDLRRHLLTHKDKSEMVTFNCDQCPYKGKDKRALNCHLIKHKDKSELVTFDCDQCPYKAKWTYELRRHLIKHKDISEVVTFNCSYCPYKTRWKGTLKTHLLIHQDISEIVTFNCDQCPYKSRHKKGLRRHLLKHRKIRNGHIQL